MSRNIFDGFTAWFSTGVKEHYKQLWKKHSGMIADFDTALYIFSEDAESDDTKRIFSTPAYCTKNLAVFHASYIESCVEAGSMEQVSIGDYVLAPKEIQNKLKNEKLFTQENTKENVELETPQFQELEEQEEFKKTNMLKTNSANRKMRTADENRTSELAAVEETNNAVDIDDLPKITGLLNDFIPGKGGCEVYLI